MLATRKILAVTSALLCMVGIIWFVVAFRWACLGGLIVMLMLSSFAVLRRPKDPKQFTRILTVQDAEAENLEVCAGSGAAPVPFGPLNGQWCELLKARRPDDVLWEFIGEEWVDGRVGRAGVALVRDGKIVGLILSAPRRSKMTERERRGFLGRDRYSRPTYAVA